MGLHHDRRRAPGLGQGKFEFRDGPAWRQCRLQWHGGEWWMEQDRLIADQLIGTQMYCDGLMEQERAVSALLGGKPTVTITGDRLALRSPAHSAELQREN